MTILADKIDAAASELDILLRQAADYFYGLDEEDVTDAVDKAALYAQEIADDLRVDHRLDLITAELRRLD